MYEVRYRDFGVDGQLPRNQAYDPRRLRMEKRKGSSDPVPSEANDALRDIVAYAVDLLEDIARCVQALDWTRAGTPVLHPAAIVYTSRGGGGDARSPASLLRCDTAITGDIAPIVDDCVPSV